jgi:methyl-accepting chemotaxis protein
MDAESSLDSYFLLKEENNIKFYYESVNLTMEYLNKLEKTADKIGENKYISLAKEIKLLINDCFKNLNEKLDYIRNNSQEKSLEFMKQAEKKNISAELGKKDDIFEETARESLTLLLQKSVELYSNSGIMIFVLIVVVVVVISVIGYSITIAISRPLRALSGAADKMATGDLNVNVNEKYSHRKDETGTLVNSFMKMNKNLSNMIKEMQGAVSIVASSSNQISSTTSELSASSAETASSVTETTTTLEEVKQTARLSNEKAKIVSESSQKTDSISQEGEKSVNETITGMNKISEQMQMIAESVLKLSDHSKTIAEIVSSVNDIAEQSNLLAVNAAIEAAKAGEQGKGFAVVAQEIKNLADQSRQSTKQVRSILDEIQFGINNSVLAAENGNKTVDIGIKLAFQAGEAIKELNNCISESVESAMQIAATSQEQLIGIEQVSTAMGSINQATVQNNEGVRQLEAASKDLKELGSKIKSLIDQFKV